MTLSSIDAFRILRFCLGADDAGSAVEHPDGTCVVTVTLCRESAETQTFEAHTFERALRQAAAAGLMKPTCVDKQIAFLARGDALPEQPPLWSVARVRTPLQPLRGQGGGDTFRALTAAIGALMHETQRERGASVLYAGSDGRLFARELVEQRRRTDQRRDALRRSLAEVPPLGPAIERRLDRATTLLNALGATRTSIQDRAVGPAHAIEVYTAVNAELLGTVDAFMVAGVTGPERGNALACSALLHAKEKTGVERARLSVAFLQDRLGPDERLTLASLLSAQTAYLQIFSSAAPRPADQLLRRLLTSPAAVEVQRMERAVFDGDAGFGINPTDWYATISRKIDMLGDVGTVVLSLLHDTHGGA